MLRDRPFLGLIAVTALLALVTDVFLVGLPVYALEELGTPAWVPGACLALVTAVSSGASTAVVHRTARWTRTAVIAAGGACSVAWCAAVAAVALVPRGWAPVCLLASTLLLAAGSVLSGTRANALAEAAAPPHARGRYLAAFQYAFTAAVLVAPLVVGLFALGPWAPWLLVAASSGLGVALVPRLARHLPPQAVRPRP